jgi:hypothetical protein
VRHLRQELAGAARHGGLPDNNHVRSCPPFFTLNSLFMVVGIGAYVCLLVGLDATFTGTPLLGREQLLRTEAALGA